LKYAFVAFTVLFFEAVLSNLVYANCVFPSASCAYHANLLIPLAFVNHRWILSFYPASISNADGQLAGIGFVGMLLSFYFWKRKVLRTFEMACLVYLGMIFLLAIFEPYALYLQWRITNYLPFLSYVGGLDLCVAVLISCLGIESVHIIKRALSNKVEKKSTVDLVRPAIQAEGNTEAASMRGDVHNKGK
jgi:hypothetical protein